MKKQKSKTIATLLAFFFGGLGLQWFYIGRPTRGLLYLLFCWTFVPVILAFIDFLVFAFMSEERFEEKYC